MLKTKKMVFFSGTTPKWCVVKDCTMALCLDKETKPDADAIFNLSGCSLSATEVCTCYASVKYNHGSSIYTHKQCPFITIVIFCTALTCIYLRRYIFYNFIMYIFITPFSHMLNNTEAHWLFSETSGSPGTSRIPVRFRRGSDEVDVCTL